MKLIADSGSTKTIWMVIENGVVVKNLQTSGLNPYFHTPQTLLSTLQTELFPLLDGKSILEVFFYGAGCSTANNNRMVHDALQTGCANAEITIDHDILGAARALFGHGKGIAGILGTGCNSCYYDGLTAKSGVDSLGYLFGDEGAGSHLGKMLIGKYLKKQLPPGLKAEFDQQYHCSLEDILNALYNKPYPNRFLANFSMFLAPRQQNLFVRQLIKESFLAFFDAQIKQYPGYSALPVSFVGSIAYFYRDILMETASEEGIGIGKILHTPVDGLAEYHR